MPPRRPHRLQELGELLDEFRKRGGIVPQAPEIEQSVLGAIFIDKSALPKCIPILGEDCSEESAFYQEKNRNIYQAILSLYRLVQPVDTVTVMQEMKRLKIDCDPVYLSDLTTGTIETANVEAHCKHLVEKRLKRDLLLLSKETEMKAAVDSADVFETIDDVQAKLLQLSSTRQIKSSVSGSSIVYGVVDRVTQGIKEPHVPSGIKSLDDMINGFYSGDSVIVAARPSIGKTALALNLASNAAQAKISVGFFSYEMRVDRLVQRMLSTLSDVYFDKIRKAELSDYDIPKIVQAAEIIHEMPMQFVQANGMSSMQLRSEMIKMKSQYNTGIIFIDYLQLIRPKSSYESQEREIAETSSAIKHAAIELDIPIVTLAQLNRKTEERQSKTPSLGDLKGSGATEADADLVILLHRPGQYGRSSEANQGIPEGYAELIIAKQRDGMTGTVVQEYKGSVLRFSEPPIHFPTFPNEVPQLLPGDIRHAEEVSQETIQF